MTEDIVTRLRNLADNGFLPDVMSNAADEIERLRTMARYHVSDKQELQMEIKRLRANAKTSAETIELLVKDVELLRKGLAFEKRINPHGTSVESRREPAATAEPDQ